MAEKQNMRRVVRKLLLGQIDRNSRLGIELLQEIAERVFREGLPPKIDIFSKKSFAA
jgi:hypothetical protein